MFGDYYVTPLHAPPHLPAQMNAAPQGIRLPQHKEINVIPAHSAPAHVWRRREQCS